MRGSDLFFTGVFTTFLLLLAFITLLPPSTKYGIPVNPDITVVVEDTSKKPTEYSHKTRSPKTANTKTIRSTTTAIVKQQETITDSKGRAIEVTRLYKQIEDLNTLLDGVSQNVASLRDIIFSYSTNTHVYQCPTNHCLPINQIKIEEITPYLRSPVWFNNNKDGRYVEDRSYLDFLANHSPRKIYLDLGGGEFASSVGWFHRNYPLTFDEIHCFEAVPNLFKIPPRYEIGDQFYDSIHFYQSFVGVSDDRERNMIDFPKWMRQVLKPTVDDFVVMKMDVEGTEWDIMAALEQGGLHQFIDELFVEIHYKHPDLTAYGWDQFSAHTIDDAISLLRHWRAIGVYPPFSLQVLNSLNVLSYAHYWP